MSSSTKTDNSQSGRLISDLRHFRFKKKPNSVKNPVESPPDGNGSLDKSESPAAADPEKAKKGSPKSIYTNGVSVSIPEGEKSPNTNAITAVALKTLSDFFPTISPLVLERCLIKCKGDVAAAKIIIKDEFYKVKSPATEPDRNKEKLESTNGSESCQKKAVNKDNKNVEYFKTKLIESFNKKCMNIQSCTDQPKSEEKSLPVKRALEETSSGIQQSKAKKIKKDRKRIAEFDESGDSDDEGYNKQDRKVFDSDEDSDVEISDDMNADQKQVYEFLSTASLPELLSMPNCSQKKAEAIIEQRPFTGWKNMVQKFQEGKNLGTEILNSAQEILYTRYVVNQLMQKCSRLAVEMKRAIAAGVSNVTTQPALLNPSLKLANYQMVGLNWLLVLHNRGLNGILADEMGLGKTIQIIAFLAYLKESTSYESEPEKAKTNLIVVPSSILDNWSNELEKWCPSLKTIVYYGSMDERKMMRIQFSQQGIQMYDIFLSTYNLLTSTPEEKKMFKVLPFNYVIFDEAHMLKNMKTQRFENLMRVNAKHRILLTGTPLQNNLLELMSLLTFVMPEMFVKKKEYLKSLFTKTTKTRTVTDPPLDSLPKFEQEQVSQAKQIMQPFVLRRLKRNVLKDLPTKTENILYCEMVEQQRAKYTHLISTFSKRAQNKEQREEKKETDDIDEQSGLSMMMDLRKLSNHPLLLRYKYDEEKITSMAKILAKEKDYKETNINYIVEDLRAMSDFQLHSLANNFSSLSQYLLNDEDFLESGKFKQLDNLLPKMKEENHRVLIFSQFVIMLDVIEKYLNIREYKYLRLDGSTQVTVRQDLIDAFNDDPSIFIFILSTRAGGLGINLTAADTVIIHDIDFNPYNDKQAEDRCHRVGQTKPVTVIRFISKDSIEENIYQVAVEKLSLEREISDGEHSELKGVVSLLKQALNVESKKTSAFENSGSASDKSEPSLTKFNLKGEEKPK